MVQIQATKSVVVVPKTLSPKIELVCEVMKRAKMMFVPVQDIKITVSAQKDSELCWLALTFDLVQVPIRKESAKWNARPQDLPEMGAQARKAMDGPRPSSVNSKRVNDECVAVPLTDVRARSRSPRSMSLSLWI